MISSKEAKYLSETDPVERAIREASLRGEWQTRVVVPKDQAKKYMDMMPVLGFEVTKQKESVDPRDGIEEVALTIKWG